MPLCIGRSRWEESKTAPNERLLVPPEREGSTVMVVLAVDKGIGGWMLFKEYEELLYFVAMEEGS